MNRKKPMSKMEWRVRMAAGWAASKIVTALPLGLTGWLLSTAGFYAFDTGYEDYCRRWRLFNNGEA